MIVGISEKAIFDVLVKSHQTALFENLQSMNSCTYEQQNGDF